MTTYEYDAWCDAHRLLVSSTDDASDVVASMVALRVLTRCEDPSRTECWACKLTEPEFQDVLRAAVLVYTQARAYGGTFITKGLAISLGVNKPKEDV